MKAPMTSSENYILIINSKLSRLYGALSFDFAFNFGAYAASAYTLIKYAQ